MGVGPLGSATVTAWQREVERDGFFAVAEALRNSSPAFKGRALPGAEDYEQIPALVERGRARVGKFFRELDARLAANEFVAGMRSRSPISPRSWRSISPAGSGSRSPRI